MTAYYNEIDPYAAQWLRNLIAAGHIAPGDVDERDIRDVRPADLAGYRQCHFFAGIGVWSYALWQAGWSDDRPVWTGSCPCQPFSAAGKGGGFADERHLWPVFFHLIGECRPSVVLGEQVASRDGLQWLDLVQDDMEGASYAFGAVDTSSALHGAPHIRQRLRWVAYADTTGQCVERSGCLLDGQWTAQRNDADGRGPVRGVADTASERRHGGKLTREAGTAKIGGSEASEWRTTGVRESEGRGTTRLLADTEGREQRWLREWREGLFGSEQPNRRYGATGFVADDSCAGLEGRDPGSLGNECSTAERGGCADGVADASDVRRREGSEDPGRLACGDRTKGISAGPLPGSTARWMGYAERERAGWDAGTGSQAQGGVGLRTECHDAGPSSTASGLGDANSRQCDGVAIVRGFECDGQDTGRAQGRGELGSSGHFLRPGPTNGFWRDADWLFCRDGKWRPVEPGTFPLAHGTPARVGRLRAYGNAVDAEATTAFVEAVRGFL